MVHYQQVVVMIVLHQVATKAAAEEVAARATATEPPRIIEDRPVNASNGTTPPVHPRVVAAATARHLILPPSTWKNPCCVSSFGRKRMIRMMIKVMTTIARGIA
jgi:hypothetical protein